MQCPKTCPKCGSDAVYKYEGAYHCKRCECHFTDWQQAEIDRLKRENEGLKLKWQDRCADDGWYWVKNFDGSLEIAYLEPYYGDDFGYDKIAGPIPEPEEKE